MLDWPGCTQGHLPASSTTSPAGLLFLMERECWDLRAAHKGLSCSRGSNPGLSAMKGYTLSWPEAAEASELKAPGLSGAWLALCVAELTSGTRAGLMLSSPDKRFFAPVCAVMAARQISPISVPHEAVFCTEVMLHSLGRGLAFLERVPMCCSSSSWGHISSWSSGDLPPQGAFLQQAGSMHTPGRACRTVLVCAGSGSPHPAPFSVMKSVLSVLPRSQFVLQLNNAWTCSLTPEMISKRI